MSKAFSYDESVKKNGSPRLQESNKAGLQERDSSQLMEVNVWAKIFSCVQGSESLGALVARTNGGGQSMMHVEQLLSSICTLWVV